MHNIIICNYVVGSVYTLYPVDIKSEEKRVEIVCGDLRRKPQLTSARNLDFMTERNGRTTTRDSRHVALPIFAV